MIYKSTIYQVEKTKVLPHLARTPFPTLTLTLLKGQLHCFLRTRRQHSSGTLQYPSRKLFPLPSFSSTAYHRDESRFAVGGTKPVGHSHERSAGRYRKYSTMHSGGSVHCKRHFRVHRLPIASEQLHGEFQCVHAPAHLRYLFSSCTQSLAGAPPLSRHHRVKSVGRGSTSKDNRTSLPFFPRTRAAEKIELHSR